MIKAYHRDAFPCKTCSLTRAQKMRRQIRCRQPAYAVGNALLKSWPIPNPDSWANQPLAVRTQKLSQSLYTIKQSLSAVRRHDQMRVVGKQQIAFLSDGSIRLQPVACQESPHAGILQTREHDGSPFRFACCLHAQDVQFQSRLILNLFREGLGGNPVFGLVSELHKNLRPRTDLESAIAHLHLFWRRLEFQPCVRHRIQSQQRWSAHQCASDNTQ